MRWLLIFAGAISLVSCGSAEDEQKAALQRQLEELRKENAEKKAQIEEVKRQLATEAARKAEAVKELERKLE